jgi:hypothetical protein
VLFKIDELKLPVLCDDPNVGRAKKLILLQLIVSMVTMTARGPVSEWWVRLSAVGGCRVLYQADTEASQNCSADSTVGDQNGF